MAAAPSLSDIHPDFITALIVNAEAEAEGVAHLLRHWDIKTRSATGELVPKQFSREFLVGINVGLRFRNWEASKICFHQEAGLPSGTEVIVRTLELISGTELAEMAESLNIASLRLFYKHFVWLAKSELQIDLGFQDQLTDEQLDALADFIWNHRNALN